MASPRSLGSRSVTSRSPIVIGPAVTSSRPASRLSSVVLPQPEGPEQDQELAVVDLEVEVLEHGHAAVGLDDVFELNAWHRPTP